MIKRKCKKTDIEYKFSKLVATDNEGYDLYVGQYKPRVWQYFIAAPDGSVNVTGKPYATKYHALLDCDSVAASWDLK